MGKSMDAKRPVSEQGHQYHINAKPGDIPRYVLLPGDPDRVEKIGELWDEYHVVARHREYHSIRGRVGAAEIGAVSTGIGAPSAAIAVEELAAIGVDTFIRVGSTGALTENIQCGDLIINSGAIRFDGTTPYYIMPEYPASAHYEVVCALIQACEALGLSYHVGVGASTSSFYTGQGRPGYRDYRQSWMEHLIPDLQHANVLNLEMETASILTLASIYGLRAGSICTVFANRVTNTFEVIGENRAIMAANKAVEILAEWDQQKKAQHKTHFYPALLSSRRKDREE